MSLYDKSSLVMIPSGKKDGTVFSQKPVDGSGDFTFSRGSNLAATRVGPTGLIEKGRENLLKYSNQFDTGWNKQNIVVSTNSVQNPFNTGTTFTMTEQVGTTQYRIYSTTLHSTTSGTMYTHSVYVKRLSGTRDFAIIDVSGGARVYFNMTTISVGSEAVGKGKIEDVGNGWYRLSVYGVATGSSALYLAMTNGTATGSETYTSDGSGSFALYAAQLEIGLAATDYIESGATTGKAGLLEDEPRFDYSGGATCGSLILEPSRTNLVKYSEYYDVQSWTKTRIDLTTNATTSPEGVLNASLIVPFTQYGDHLLRDDNNFTSLTIGQKYTLSAFAKQAGYRYYRLYTTNANTRTTFDLSTGTMVDNTGDDFSITDMGNGWYRLTHTFTATATSEKFRTKILDNNLADNYIGDGTSGIYVFGHQFEQGTYPTSYIPNHSGGSVTRGAEGRNYTGFSSLIGQTEGTLFLDIDSAENNTEIFSLNRSTANSIFLTASLGLYRAFIYADGANISSFTSINTSDRIKIAIAYQSNNFAIYANGLQVYTNNTQTWTPNVAIDLINFNNGGYVTSKGVARYNQMMLFKERLSNADLETLTTL